MFCERKYPLLENIQPVYVIVKSQPLQGFKVRKKEANGIIRCLSIYQVSELSFPLPSVLILLSNLSIGERKKKTINRARSKKTIKVQAKLYAFIIVILGHT